MNAMSPPVAHGAHSGVSPITAIANAVKALGSMLKCGRELYQFAASGLDQYQRASSRS